MKTGTVTFNVVGSVEQCIQITDPELTFEALVEGMKEGVYFTTLPHISYVKATISKKLENGQLQDVAIVLSQMMDGDARLANFSVGSLL